MPCMLLTLETTIVYRGYMGIMEKKMEATIVYRGYVGNGSSGSGSCEGFEANNLKLAWGT